MSIIDLGIIGYSDGNGHPYSWSAICNGYSDNFMKNSKYPNIYTYLSEKNYPDDFITEAKVKYIWSQNYNISKEIARCSNIQNPVSDINQLISNVDANLPSTC